MVRLPLAHCKLNPIEIAWSQVKGYVKENNKKYRENNNQMHVLNSGACEESHLLKLKSWYTKDLRK